ncbi:MAG: TonB-dependent receptor [Bacteroidetes bacterium]|nr:TonB-dependent receptor [Bacteroidota bacterium]
MKKTLYLLLGWLLCASTALGQIYTISGTVLDSISKQPLVGATVILDHNRSKGATKTDEKGEFTLTVDRQSHVVAIRYVGYVPYSKYFPPMTRSLKITVLLDKTENQLEEVVITTKGFDQTIRQPILGVNQINIKTFQKLPSAFGEVDLLRGIQMLPGVTSVGEASNGVNIRGGTTDQNLILLDDTPIFNPTHMFGLFSVFPPDAVSTLDLYKGNVPGRYGGRAASVLDIKLRNPALDSLKIKGGVSIVSNRLMVNVPVVKDKLGFYVAARGAFNDFLLPIASDKLKDIKAKFGEGVWKGFWKINPKNTLTGTFYKSYDLFSTNLLPGLPNVIGEFTRYQHTSTNAAARWLTVISPKMDIQTTAVYAHYTPQISTQEKDTDNFVDLNSDLTQKQLKSNLNYVLTNYKLETGLSFTRYDIQPGELVPNNSASVSNIVTPSERANEWAWHADNEYSVNKQLAISVGLRYSYFQTLGPALYRNYEAGQPRDDFSVIDSVQAGNNKVFSHYGGFEPRVGIRYALSERQSFKFGYNLMRQYLQIVSNTTTPIPTSRWKTSDLHIKPQISNLLSAGYYYSFPNDIYEISVEGYYRFTRNMVDYKPGADFLLQPYPETQIVQGLSKAYGLEVMLTKKKGRLNGWVNYTYSRTFNRTYTDLPSIEQVNNGDWYRANYDRPHSVNTSFDISIDKHNSFSFTFIYSTGRPYTQPVGFVNYLNNFFPFYEARNNKRVPDYHRLDFAWNIYNPSMKDRRFRGKWAFTVYNLYARRNVYSVFFKTEKNISQAKRLQIFGAPIVSLAYNFEF